MYSLPPKSKKSKHYDYSEVTSAEKKKKNLKWL